MSFIFSLIGLIIFVAVFTLIVRLMFRLVLKSYIFMLRKSVKLNQTIKEEVYGKEEQNIKENEEEQSHTEILYTPKKNPMSERELNFFHNLELLIGDKYYIVPQVHLSSILDAPEKPNWYKYNPDFTKINAKSVDFALFTKPDYDFKLAIELDDSTHLRKDRMDRDGFVNEVMDKTGQKLVRMNSFDVTRVVEYL